MDEDINSGIHSARNRILQQYAELSFQDALESINQDLTKEKNKGKRLALFSAKSWVLRNKLHSALHDPYIYSLNEVENTDIFDDLDSEGESAIDGLFDDDEAPDVIEQTVDVEILKNTSINGHKVLKGSVVSVTEENANKLLNDGKARLKT
ncbi:MAG: hypothetical protein EBW83_10290 [Rhodobacterales bacterium]|jgi:hypothetical protein|nr:hypothetical protein [Rhodobacterales bacterium]NCX55103.1 hypothetical protein [Rhodobacterales bacterium]NCX86457.1 hypothetical protein [Paracoccaceae bacterium]